MSSQFLNFNEVEATSASIYFNPGQYTVTPTEVKLVEVGAEKTKALAVTFVHEDGRVLEEKFFLQGKTTDSTKKMLGRLQYLHEKLYGMGIKAEFTSYEQASQYFHDALLKKKHSINVVIGGKFSQKDGRLYCNFPYGGFIYEGNDPFEEKEYPQDSIEYKRLVTVEKSNPAPAANTPVIGSPMTNGTTKLPWQ
jgi:hypothetical protein